jgi:hypothetical protein
MKIALCLSGYFGSTANPSSDGSRGFEYIKKTLLDLYNIDVFVHTWDGKNEALIKKLYKPWLKDIAYEEQLLFKSEVDAISKNESYFKQYGNPPSTPFLMLSQAYSRKKSINLKKDYEKRSNILYDAVIYSRFDLGIRDLHTSEIYRCCEIVFSPNFDMKYFYSKFWNQLNQGFGDMWFFSSSENMDIYSTYFDKLVNYLDPNSHYITSATNGWFDSSATSEFSGEMLKLTNRSNTLTTFLPNWAYCNNHMLIKWFLKDVSLYEKCLFPIDNKRFSYVDKDYLNKSNINPNKVALLKNI